MGFVDLKRMRFIKKSISTYEVCQFLCTWVKIKRKQKMILMFRRSTVEQIYAASENLGFFQDVNHGIPMIVIDKMLQGVHRFHEQDLTMGTTKHTDGAFLSVLLQDENGGL